MYNNRTHSSLQGGSPNEVYGDQSDLSKIAFALQPQELLKKLEERSNKGLFVGIDRAGFKIFAILKAGIVKVVDENFLEQMEAQAAGIARHEDEDMYFAPPSDHKSMGRPLHSGTEETIARILQYQELGLHASHTDPEEQLEEKSFVGDSRSEAWMPSTRQV